MADKLSYLVSPKAFALLGCLFGFLSVAAGSFGAHALKAKISQDLLAVFEIGVRYQMYHALALLGVAWALDKYSNSWIQIAGSSFTIGVLIFSGSLYLLALSGNKMWGAVTPIGGLFLLAGWLLLGIVIIKA